MIQMRNWGYKVDFGRQNHNQLKFTIRSTKFKNLTKTHVHFALILLVCLCYNRGMYFFTDGCHILVKQDKVDLHFRDE